MSNQWQLMARFSISINSRGPLALGANFGCGRKWVGGRGRPKRKGMPRTGGISPSSQPGPEAKRGVPSPHPRSQVRWSRSRHRRPPARPSLPLPPVHPNARRFRCRPPLPLPPERPPLPLSVHCDIKSPFNDQEARHALGKGESPQNSESNHAPLHKGDSPRHAS